MFFQFIFLGFEFLLVGICATHNLEKILKGNKPKGLKVRKEVQMADRFDGQQAQLSIGSMVDRLDGQ